MRTAELIKKIEKLPLEKRKEVEDFIQFLVHKIRVKKNNAESKLGIFKDRISISDDFDEPIDDFKAYM